MNNNRCWAVKNIEFFDNAIQGSMKTDEVTQVFVTLCVTEEDRSKMFRFTEQGTLAAQYNVRILGGKSGSRFEHRHLIGSAQLLGRVLMNLASNAVKYNRTGAVVEDAADEEEVDFAGKTVLLVEDNDLNREIAESILKEMGFSIVSVMDGLEATRRIRSLDRPDAGTGLGMNWHIAKPIDADKIQDVMASILK